MTTYRLWPSTNGPAAATSYTGPFIAGTVFTVTKGGMWFQGYWWWCATTGQSTAAVKCALWQFNPAIAALQPAQQRVMSGSVVTSGVLTAGQWNFIAVPTPIPLSLGDTYIAAIGFNNAFPDTNNYWSTTGASGIVNGPLMAFGPAGTSYWAGGFANPEGVSQGCFSSSSNDPSIQIPLQTSGTDNFWADVQVSDTAPVGYSGTYRLWPNRVMSDAMSAADDQQAYIVGTEVKFSAPVAVTKIWYFVPAHANQIFADHADVWSVDVGGVTGSNVISVATPTWKNADGSTAVGTSWAGGWVYCDVPSTPTLPAADYRVSVYASNGTTSPWSTKRLSYWGVESGNSAHSAIGINGITNGPLFAPDTAHASTTYSFQGVSPGVPVPTFTEPGQSPFQMGPPNSFPNVYVGVNSPAGALFQNYWIDIEGTSGSVNGTGSMTAGPITMTATGVIVRTGTGSMTAGPISLFGAGVPNSAGMGSMVSGPITMSAIGTVEQVASASLIAGPITLFAVGAVTVPPSGTSPGRVSLTVERGEDINTFQDGDLIVMTLLILDEDFFPVDPDSAEVRYQVGTMVVQTLTYSGVSTPAPGYLARTGTGTFVAWIDSTGLAGVWSCEGAAEGAGQGTSPTTRFYVEHPLTSPV